MGAKYQIGQIAFPGLGIRGVEQLARSDKMTHDSGG
jgi:hypothetical protein